MLFSGSCQLRSSTFIILDVRLCRTLFHPGGGAGGSEVNVASLKLCKQLSELSRWKLPKSLFNQYWELRNGEHILTNKPYPHAEAYPAYDLGYLLRKVRIAVLPLGNGRWCAISEKYSAVEDGLIEADTPEDAAAKLAIELFNQGVITPEGRQ